MPTLKLWTFSKRQNSTAQPPDAQAVTRTVDLKAAVSMLQPVFLLSEASTPTWNYCQFEGRYYHITDITSVRKGLWEISASVDVLATYKTDILASSAFVAYDTAANTELSDHRLSAKTTQTTVINTGQFSTLGSGVCAVLTITGKESVSSFALNVSEAVSLLNSVNTWMDQADVLPLPQIGLMTDVAEILDVLGHNLVAGFRTLVSTGKVGDSIRAAYLMPFSKGSFWGESKEIYLGNYPTGVWGKRIPGSASGRVLVDTITIQIPWQATDWRRNAPWHELYLYIPYIGLVSLSPSDVIGEDTITITALIDAATGSSVFNIKTSKTLAQFNSNLASEYAIGSSNLSPMQTFAAIGSAAGAAAAVVATGGAAAPAVAAGSGAIAGISNNITGNPSCIGSNAGGVTLRMSNECRVYTVFHDTNVTPDSVSGIIGTPTMAVKQIPSSGYVETRCMSVSGSMSETERQEINSLMNGGVYIE